MPNIYSTVCVPLFEHRDITVQAHGAIGGKCFVSIDPTSPTSGPGLATTPEGSNIIGVQTGAGGRVFGVAHYDAADGTKVGLHGNRKIVPVVAGATVAAGDDVQSDANGHAITATSGKVCGVCVIGATVGNDCFVALGA